MNYLMGLCVGTSSIKALLANTKGKVIGTSEVKYSIDSPHPGWTEQKPETWFNSSVKAVRDILDFSAINPDDIISLGVSGQAHSTVFLDKEYKVIRPAPLWNDQRTIDECRELKEIIGEKEILKLTSNNVTTSFSLTKILWLRNNEPENFKKLAWICLSKDYIKLKLSGKLSTDPSDAATTLCYDVKNYRWSTELMDRLKLDPLILPEVEPSDKFSAKISKKASFETGLPEGLPILTGATDTSGEMLGNGVYRDGQALVILGTGGVFLVYHSNYYKSKGILDMFRYPDGKYYSLGVTLSSSASMMWGLNNLGLDLKSTEKKVAKNIKHLDFKKYVDSNKFKILDSEISGILPGSNGLIFLPYLAGERAPHADPDAQGVLFGLNLQHDKRYILRSIMEGVAFSQRDCIEVVKKEGFKIEEIIISGGGAKNKIWCQMFSDIFNSRIIKMSTEEGPSLGMCMLGAVSLGIYGSIEEASKRFLKTENIYTPDERNTEIYDKLYEVYHDLYFDLRKTFAKIQNFKKSFSI